MNKFKVGDKVKIVINRKYQGCGEIVEVLLIPMNREVMNSKIEKKYILKFADGTVANDYPYYEDELELITNRKVGWKCTCRVCGATWDYYDDVDEHIVRATQSPCGHQGLFEVKRIKKEVI